MVDSPLQPSQIVTTDIPQSKLTGADIAQPYQLLARSLDDASQSTEKIATSLAEQAGTKAVTRDDQGNLQVQRAPIFGAAGEAYARAVKIAALTESEGKAERDDVLLRQQYRDNPEGYLQAADAYKRKTVDQVSQAAGPEVGLALGRSLERTTTQTWKGLLNEKESLDLQRANNTITAGITSASDDAIALARQGVAADDPSMKGLLDKYTTLLDEKLQNPRLAYTQEQHDLDLEEFRGQLAGARNLYHVDQVYKTQGYQPAVDAAKDVLTNDSYKLTPSQRQAFYSHAMGEIRANEAIRRQDVGEARSAFRELSTASQLGQRIAPEEVESVRQAFRSAGYPAGIAMVDAAFAHKDLHDDFGRQPLSGQTQDVNAIKGAEAAKQAYQFFIGKGYRPEEAAGIVGNLVHESGMNPASIGDSGTSVGLAQFHNERAAALRQFAASRGKPVTDFQTQLEFVDQELRTTEAPTRALLSRATTPEQAAAAFINYERPQGYDPNNLAAAHGYQNRINLAASVFKGQATDGSGGPGVASWLLANRSATLDDNATKAWKQVWQDWSGGNGGPPSNDRVEEILNAARATGNIDLQTKIGQDMDLIDRVQRMSQLPVGEQVALQTELRRRQQMGQTDAGTQLVQKQLAARTEAIRSGLQDNPIATAVANFPDKFKTPPPLNVQDPDQLVAGLKMRAQIAQIAAANWQTGPLSALDSQDLAQVKTALQSPDPAVKAGLYGALAQLPEDVRGATLRKIGGNEPASMAEAAAGSLMGRDPAIAMSIFRGQAAMKADKRYDPTTENEGKRTYFADLDKALPATTFTFQDRTDPAGAYATMGTMVRARYADLSAQAGDSNYSADRLKQAVTDVTGGILTHNGGTLVAPARGMGQAQFDGVLRGIEDDDLKGVTTLSGQPVTSAYLRDSARLESAGDGRYFVLLGNDPMRPVYAYQGANSEAPGKFVLDLRGRAAAPVGTVMPPPNPL